MLHGALTPDPIGQNPAVIDEIKARLLRLDDEIPFLLLPVRIETRFVRADRPSAVAADTADLEKRLGRLGAALRAASTRDLSAAHGAAKKKAHAFVEAQLAEVEAQAAGLQQNLDEFSSGDSAQIRSITKLVRDVSARVELVKKNLENLKSDYKRAELVQRWQALEAHRLQPLCENINERVVPRLKFRNRLSTVAASDVLEQLTAARGTLSQVNRRAPTGAWRERRPHPGTAPAEAAGVLEDLTRLGGLLAHAVEAAADERRALADAGRSLDEEIGAWIERVEDDAVRVQASEARRAIAALSNAQGARSRVVRTKDLDRSAQAYSDMLTELRRLLQALRQPAGRDAFEQALSALADYRTASATLEALARQLVAIPAQSQRILEATVARVRERVEEQLDTLARAADNRPFRKDELKILDVRTRRVLAALGASVAAISATGQPAKTSAPLVFVSRTATTVRPELWVRIFPDDVVVQTHDPALTASELEHGRRFWQEYVAAGSDENLKRASWSSLCAYHPPHRAAWIARRLQAELHQAVRPSRAALAAANAKKALAQVRKMVGELAAREAPASNWISEWAARATKALQSVTDNFLSVAELGTQQARNLGEQLAVLESQLRALLARFSSRPRAERLQISDAFEALLQEHATCSEALSSLATRPDAELEVGVMPLQPLGAAELADESWRDAAHVRLLPKRFVVVAIRGEQALHVIAGKEIPAKVTVGIGPGGAGEGAESFSLSENGDLVVDPRMRWMTSYDAAVEQGMAVTIPLTETDATQGFDRLLVVGVRETSAAADRRMLEELLEGHRYTPGGFELLPLGTPTNNTESAASGHSLAERRDAGARYELEFGDPQYATALQTGAADTEKTDGFRLATALGIDPEAFARVRHAGGRQISDAIVVNRLLWPATMGHYLEEMLAPIVSVPGARHVAEYFSRDVLARGSQPSIRIGTQPYAVLPTMAFRAFRSHRKWVFPPAAQTEAHADAVLAAVLGQLESDWLKLARTRVKRSSNWNQADPKQHFLDMMAVHPTASELHWRYAMNSAPHIPLTSSVHANAGAEALLSVTYHHLLDRFRFLLEQAYVALEAPAGSPPDRVKRWEKITLLAKAAPAYDVRYLARESPISGATSPGALSLSVGELRPIIDSLTAAHPDTLVAASHSSDEHASLLAMLLRHSVLCAYREAAMDIWGIEGLLSDEQRLASGSSGMFNVPSFAPQGGNYLTKWSYLLCSAPELRSLAGGGFSRSSALTAQLGTRTLAQDLAGFAAATSLVDARFAPALRRLSAYKEQLLRLKQVDDIDRLLREHLDLCSYRLDAWRTGLATRRLRQQRARSAARGLQRPGAYVGAYGWVEDLKPDAETPAYAAAVPEGLTHLGEDPVYKDPRNEGLIYAPSVNHAVTAAVLRSGYLSSTARPDLDSERAVNLSSKRVRTARWLLTGIRNGNSLGALLGYRLERALHEAYDLTTGVELDRYVFKLRREFPTAAAVDPQATAAADRQRQVLDGLALLERVRSHVVTTSSSPTLYDALRSGNYQGFPWGLESRAGELLIPSKTAVPALDAFAAALDDVADALDAVGDLLLAEGVYQVARGNLERASAVTSAMAEGSVPPDPQIVDTPRTGIRLTQRVVFVTRPLDGRSLSRVDVPDAVTRAGNQRAVRPLGWTSQPLTPRACLDPTLNAWLATFLGASGAIAAYLVDERDSSVPAVQVRLSDLGLQPVDLVSLLGSGVEQGLARLAEHTVVWAKSSGAIVASEALHWRAVTGERHPSWSPDVCSFRDAAMSCEALYRVLTSSRTATAADFDLIEQRAAAAAVADAPDLGELSTRILECVSQLADFVRSIATLVTGAYDDTKLELDELGAAVVDFLSDEARVLGAQPDIEAALMDAWRFGIDAAAPAPALGAHETHSALVSQLRATYRAGSERIRAAESALVAAASVADFQECARQLFGGQATVAACFRLGNSNALREQLEAPGAAALTRALGPDALDDWLHGASKVRERMAALERARLLNDVFDRPLPDLRPAQLPYAAGDYWLGAEFPSDHQPSGDKLSLVFLDDPKLFAPADDVRMGLVLDEWNETIPARTETTGVTFHYDAPDASPPQCLLLVVTPVESGKWYWEDLVHALDETLDLASVRMVEPDHLQDEFYGHLLPALSSEVLPDGVDNNDGDRPSLNLSLAGAGQGGP